MPRSTPPMRLSACPIAHSLVSVRDLGSLVSTSHPAILESNDLSGSTPTHDLTIMASSIIRHLGERRRWAVVVDGCHGSPGLHGETAPSVSYASHDFTNCPLSRPVGGYTRGCKADSSTMRVAPDMRPDRTFGSTFWQVRAIQGNGLRSRERRFESCRGHWSEA